MAGKRYEKAAGLVDRKKTYAMDEAVGLLKGLPHAKFDETVELSASLNIQTKKGDQLIRGTLTLPHGTGKRRTVLAICRGERELQAKTAGADYVGAGDLIQKIQDGWMDFDVVIATPEMMREVSRLGKLLGPRGLMPSPKAGTVAEDVAKAVEDVRRGKMEFKMDKLANIHLAVGKLSFEARQLGENIAAAIQAILRVKPASVKGRFIKRLGLGSTMSPGLFLKTEGLEAVS